MHNDTDELLVSNLNTMGYLTDERIETGISHSQLWVPNRTFWAVVLHKVWEHAFPMDSSGSLPGLGLGVGC